jgi:N-methylhydantoinase A/oxoprolinase/acetone carboxylase beta subunit
MIDVVGLGGGGGSIASLTGNSLQVGPESAGAVPGPVCYDLGSTSPTVTDANLVLALTSPDNFLGGRRQVNVDLARQSIEETIARPLNLQIENAALEIRSVLAESLARSIRAEAGKRSFPLHDAVVFAYGGAGPLHAADIAAAIGVSVFYMFPESPVFSAAGSSTMDIQHFYESHVQARDGESLKETLTGVATDLRNRALRDMRGEGFDPSAAKLRFVLENSQGEQLPFTWQELGTLSVDLTSGGLLRLMATLEKTGPDGSISEISSRASQTPGMKREVVWPGGRSMTAVFSYPRLEPGERVAGPALVETAETTCVIPGAWQAATDRHGALKVWRD